MIRKAHRSGTIIVVLTVIAMLLAIPQPVVSALSQATETQATLGSGTVVTWQDPWGGPFIEPNSVNLVTADGTVFNVDAYPVAEHSPETAAALTPEGQYTVFDSGPEGNGGFYQISGSSIFDPLSGSERTFFAYSRTWPSADGQWTIATQLQTELPFFHRDLASIPGSITVDGAPLWADVDPAVIVASLQQATGLEFPAPDAPVPTGSTPDSPIVQDVPNYATDTTLTNGTVIGLMVTWAETENSSPDSFQATTGDAVLLAGDYPAGTPIEDVWSELLPVLSGSGTLADEGDTPDGGKYALATLTDTAGTQRYALARVMVGPGTQVPVFAVVIGPAATFDQALMDARDIGVNNQPLFAGIDEAAVLATLQAGGPTGAAIFTGGQASAPSPTEPAEQPPSQGGGANEITGVAGTLFSWTSDWTYEPLDDAPSIVILYGVSIPGSIMIFEGEAGQSVEEAWNGYSSSGGTTLEEGQSPDGGFYEISMNEADPTFGGLPSSTFVRAYAANAAPVIVYLTISGTDFEPAMEAARGVTTDGVSILEGVDEAALIATFENEGPTGAAIFTGGEPSAPADDPGSDSGSAPDTGSQGTSPRDIIANVPPGMPDRTSDPDPTPEDDASSYTSDLLGYTLEWADSWVPYEDVTEANEDEGYDLFALQTEGAGSGAFSLFGTQWDQDYDARDYIDYWSSDEYVEENFIEGTEVVVVDSRRNSGAVVFVGPFDEDDPELWVTIYEVVNIDDELRLEASLIAPLSEFEDIYDDARESITLDGDEIIGYFSTEEIMDELPKD